MEEPSLVPRRRPSRDSTLRGYASLKHASEDSVELHDMQNFAPYPPHRRNTDGPLRPHFGTADVRRGYLMILSVFFLAVLVACMNHVAFSQLNGKETGSHTSQFWVTVLKNVFPATVAVLLLTGLKHCLSQVALYRIRLGSHPLALVNLITSSPSFLNTASILFKSSMRASILWFVLLAAITQAVALISIFVPGTLTIAQTPSRTQSLMIPTIDFNVINPMVSSFVTAEFDEPQTLGFIEPSQRWRQSILRAGSSSTAPTWDPPGGCGSSCTYSFSYSAPALNCTELSKNDIWPTGTNTSDSRLPFPLNSTDPNETLNQYFFYNSIYSFTATDSSNENVSLSVLDIIYMENFNTTFDVALGLATDFPNPTKWTPRGVHCTYQNATYEATTTFLNNTQLSSTHVQEWHGLLPIGHDADGPYADESLANMTLAFRSIAQSFNELFRGNAFYQTNMSSLVTDSTQSLYTPLFNLTGDLQNVTDSSGNSSMWNVFYFSLPSTLGGNLSAGLQDLLGNVTLAFVDQRMASTLADVDVTPDSTQYQYVGWKLGLIYGIVFGGSLMVVVYGLFCLRANGTTAIFDLEHILEMTAASTALHESAVNPRFGSTLVKGIFFSESGGHKRVALDVD
ncbi:hypothetical protein GYMLUDRAFT_265659 [Collybiopsis luxurians FD-317 M1]|uniref:Uncharacterized protein n=1 Tax=Collybiopsis luxurians FD-317 M1 TaxID=944289 RepID=A0A0D0BQQ6_9AGAR|nr:hypothetical protein GYMLUDRAFT_265659 [Collybiopsis luxurians FD-317 M1]